MPGARERHLLKQGADRLLDLGGERRLIDALDDNRESVAHASAEVQPDCRGLFQNKRYLSQVVSITYVLQPAARPQKVFNIGTY